MNSKFQQAIYRISPFATADHSRNHDLKGRKSNYLTNFFPNYDYLFCDSGRSALHIALSSIGLCKSDEVWVVTTSQNEYVSSCVTDEILKFCSYCREYSEKTRVILVIHEFGKFYSGVDKLSEYGVPLIEDFAHSFSALFYDRKLKCEYAIFSLSKFLPILKGGLLLSAKYSKKKINDRKDSNLARSVFSLYETKLFEIFYKRKQVEYWYREELEVDGCEPFFSYTDTECAGAYLIKINRPVEFLHEMKLFMQNRGVECSVFYNLSVFFVPCHHRLNQFDVRAISRLIKNYLRGKNDI